MRVKCSRNSKLETFGGSTIKRSSEARVCATNWKPIYVLCYIVCVCVCALYERKLERSGEQLQNEYSATWCVLRGWHSPNCVFTLDLYSIHEVLNEKGDMSVGGRVTWNSGWIVWIRLLQHHKYSTMIWKFGCWVSKNRINLISVSRVKKTCSVPRITWSAPTNCVSIKSHLSFLVHFDTQWQNHSDFATSKTRATFLPVCMIYITGSGPSVVALLSMLMMMTMKQRVEQRRIAEQGRKIWSD